MRTPVLLALGVAFLPAQQPHVNLDFHPQAPGAFKPFGAALVSPEVSPDRRATFRLRAPQARQVLLTGPVLLGIAHAAGAAPKTAPLPFGQEADGLWTLTTPPIPPGIYVYRLRVDGLDIVDPNNTLNGYSNQPAYGLIVVPGEGPAIYDARPVPHGTVTRHVYHSAVTQGERELYVYCPPGYSPKKRYPVLYLLGGSGELAHNWAVEGRVNFILDNLLAEGRARPMLIVMPNNQMVHRGNPAFREQGPGLLEQDLRRHVIPLVDGHYSTLRKPAGRALAGLSMGGGHTQTVGFRSLDLFASFGILSAGNRDTETASAAFLNDPKVNEKVRLLFVGQGTYEAKGSGPTGAGTAALKQALEKHGVKHVYYEGGIGAHDWGTWRHLMAEQFLPQLWR